MTNFDATIAVLRERMPEFPPFPPASFEVEIEAAIRVLEAGGKVDKIGCAVELAGCGCRYCNQLRNVVAALPEGEKK